MKFDEILMKTVQKDLNVNLIPMLLGEPGIGKSSWLEALARINNTRCFTLACNQLADKADLTGARGVPVMKNGVQTGEWKQIFYPHAVISDAVDYADSHPDENPILFLDELNRTTPDITSEALSLPTMRKIGSTSLPENLRIVIAGNDKGNVVALDEASTSRFVLYNVVPDTATFCSVVSDLNPMVRDELYKNPDLIFCKKAESVSSGSDDDQFSALDELIDSDEEMAQITTPRTIDGLSRWLNACSDNDLLEFISASSSYKGVPTNALCEIVYAHIGQTPFAEKMIENIQSHAASLATSQNASKPMPKPLEIDMLKKCRSQSAVEKQCAMMSQSSKVACLLYLLSLNEDNDKLIGRLAASMDALDVADKRMFADMILAQQISTPNMDALENSGTSVGAEMAGLFSQLHR